MEKKYALSDQQISNPLAGEKIILNFSKGNYYSLDEVGAFIWELLTTKPHSFEEIIEEVQENFDVDKTNCSSDIELLIQDLLKENLIIEQ